MSKQHIKLTARVLAALACLAALSGWLGWRVATVVAANGLQAEGYKTVDIDRQTSMDPVSIEKITVGGQVIRPGVSTAAVREVRPGMPFQADGDWLKKMSISIKNRTDKVLVRAEIRIYFPDTGDGSASRPVTAYTITLVQVPEIDSFNGRGQQSAPEPNKQPLLLAPGQTLVIPVADYVDEMQSLVGEKILFSQVTRVVIDRLRFFFVDGLRWKNLDGFAAPDPNHPGQFTNLDRSRYFPGNSSQNWPPADAPGEARHTYQH